MSDADGRTIPYLDEDMGEGVKDFFPTPELQSLEQKIKRLNVTEKADPNAERSTISVVLEKVEALDRKLDHIFDGHVLMNGQFKKLL